MAMPKKMGPGERRFTLWGVTYRYSEYGDAIRPEDAPSCAVLFEVHEPVYVELWPEHPAKLPPNLLHYGMTKNLAKACVRFALGHGWMSASRTISLGLNARGQLALRQ